MALIWAGAAGGFAISNEMAAAIAAGAITLLGAWEYFFGGSGLVTPEWIGLRDENGNLAQVCGG